MKLRKIITMGLAAIMAVSAMSISAFAANIPMRSEVDTKAASADNPVTYRTEDGIKSRFMTLIYRLILQKKKSRKSH